MKLILTKWPVLVLLSIMLILAGGCSLQPLPITLKADRTVVSPGGDTSIECVVSNSTGNMDYRWSCNGGSVRGEGESADWSAPDSFGDYAVKVVVKGENGGWGTAAVIITVRENHAPIIEDLVVTAEHKYLKELEDYYKVGKDQMYYIECQAWDEDNDDLAYDWSCDNGEISGTGAKVTWKAPNVNGDVNVTVTVSDGRNGVATQDVLLNVVACSPCTFK